MRRLILFATAFYFYTFSSEAQQIPNGGFETWVLNPFGNEIPVGWIPTQNNAQTVAKDTDVFAGDYCMRVMSRQQGFEGWLPGHISVKVAAASLEGEINCMMSVDTIEHYDGDSSYAVIIVDTAANYTWGSTGNIAYFKMSGTTPNYVGVNVPFVLPAGTDSFYIHVAAQNVITPLGSGGYASFRVDEMSATFEPNGLVETEVESELHVFPNPANGILFFNGVRDATRFDVFDLTGRLTLNGLVENHAIDISVLHNGHYLLRLIGTNGVAYDAFFSCANR